MRILHYVDSFDKGLGGVVQYVSQVTRALAMAGIDATLATAKNVDIPPEWLDETATKTPTVFVLDQPAGKQGWLNSRQTAQLVELALDHDVVHLHGAWDLGNVRFARRLNANGIPYIVSAHGMLDDWSINQKRLKKQVFLVTIGRQFYRQAAMVHCTADAETDQVRSNVGKSLKTICVVPYVVPPAEFEGSEELAYKKYPRLRADTIKLLFLSRLHYKKSPDLLIRAAAKLIDQGHDIQVLMAGPGDEDYVAELKQVADESGIAERVLWFGMVREPLKSAIYDASDIFVLPTQQENFGIVLVEAMFAGLPIVTTRGTDIYRELEQGGAVIADHSADGIANGIAKLLENPDDLAARGERGRQFAREWLDEQKTIEAHLDMYRQAIATARE